MTTIDLDLVPAMQRALGESALVLHYQPEIDLTSGAVVGMEALLRWQHPGRGLLWPGDFLPVAEATGLDVTFGDWVLENCVQELSSWRNMPNPRAENFQLWVNISAAQLSRPDFVRRVAALVAESRCPFGTLGLEVTEQALATRGKEVPAILNELHEAGVALAIDDFGTWYSSLATLGELPVDAVKLDRSFVRGVGSDLEEDNIVASVIRLAHARDLYVVAEGVESWAEGARLCELGCDRAHGYLFSGPVRAEEARRMLARHTGWRVPTVMESRPN
jgi:EAL domain-containing protein (putative c-di-GMP-specific phosphodiesterase class I)